MATFDDLDKATGQQGFIGLVKMTPQDVVLQKGQPQRLFIPGVDPEGVKRAAVWVNVDPLSLSLQPIELKLMTFDPRWHAFLSPSYKALGVGAAAFGNGLYCRYRWDKTGNKYTGRDANGQPVEKDEKALVIVEIFPTKEAAEAANNYNPPAPAQPSTNGNGNGHPPTPQPQPVNQNDAEREIALKFLPHLVRQAAGNAATLQSLLNSNQLCGKFFAVNSPEVQAEADKLGVTLF